MLLGLFLITFGFVSLAHHPHDPIGALAVSPSYNADQTLLISYSDQLFKSVNGGHSWKALVNGLDHKHSISSVAFAPEKNGASTLYIATLGDGVYRSTNGGASWKAINTNLHNLEISTLSIGPDGSVLALDTLGGIHVTSNSGEAWQAAALPGDVVVTAMALKAQAPDTKILAGGSLGQLLLSTDGGKSWQSVGQLPVKTSITIIEFDPSDTSGSTYFAGTQDKGLFRTADNGASFKLLDKGLLSTDPLLSLAFSPHYSQDHTLVATTWHEAAFISSDGGDSWKKYAAGLTTDKQADVPKHLSPYFSRVEITGQDRQTLFLAAFTGLFKSTNGGHSWQELETRPVRIIKGLALSAPRDGQHSVALCTYGGGAYVSDDDGASWTIGNKGLQTTRLSDMAFTPTYADDHTLISGSQGFLLRSMDSGTSWETERLLYKPWRKRILQKLMALGLPKDIGQRFTTSADRHGVYPTIITLSPNYADDKTIFFGTRWHGMYRSEDGGLTSVRTWDESKGSITALVISPDYPNDHTLFNYIRGDGTYKSVDSGDSWRRLSGGLPAGITVARKEKKISVRGDFSISLSPGYAKDQTLFAGTPFGLFKSSDRGENWSEIGTNAFGAGANILAVAVSPDFSNDHMLLVTLKGRGLFQSLDGGQHFAETGKALINDNRMLEWIAYSSEFSHNRTIYAATDYDLLRSTDAGNSWRVVDRPVRNEDLRKIIRYTGDWTREDGPDYSASTVHYSETPGDRATLDFVGCGIRLLATKSPQGGTGNIYIDNVLVDSVDLHSEHNAPMTEAFSKTGLSCGPHTVSLEVAAAQSGHASGQRVVLDAFDVLSAQQ